MQLEEIDRYVEQALFYARSEYVDKDYLIKEISLKSCVDNVITRNKQGFILNNIDNRRDYLIESETIHITYPIEETLERIKVLYNVIGKKEWEETFGFNYKLFYDFIVVIIYRIFMFNYGRITHDVEYIKRYEDAFPDSKKC